MRAGQISEDHVSMKEYDLYQLLGRCVSPLEGSGAQELSGAISAGVDWAGVFRVAGEGLMTPSLAGALQRKGLQKLLPEEPRKYLQAIQQLNHERNSILRGELIRVIKQLNAIGIQPLLLKGSISLVVDQYPGCEDRVLGDLDLAVPTDVEKAVFDLLNQGPYGAPVAYGDFYERDDHHHAPPLLHDSLPVTIELHRHALISKYQDVLPMEQVWEGSNTGFVEGAEFKVPSVTDQVLHTFTHAQLQDYHHLLRRLSLRSMLEFAGLRATHEDVIDWDLIKKRLGACRLPSLESYLCAVRDLFGQAIPDAIPVRDQASRHFRSVRATLNSPFIYGLRYKALWLKRVMMRLTSPAWYRRRMRRLMRREFS